MSKKKKKKQLEEEWLGYPNLEQCRADLWKDIEELNMLEEMVRMICSKLSHRHYDGHQLFQKLHEPLRLEISSRRDEAYKKFFMWGNLLGGEAQRQAQILALRDIVGDSTKYSNSVLTAFCKWNERIGDTPELREEMRKLKDDLLKKSQEEADPDREPSLWNEFYAFRKAEERVYQALAESITSKNEEDRKDVKRFKDETGID